MILSGKRAWGPDNRVQFLLSPEPLPASMVRTYKSDLLSPQEREAQLKWGFSFLWTELACSRVGQSARSTPGNTGMYVLTLYI